MSVYDWLFGLGLMFGLAMALSYYTSQDLKGFFIFLTVFNAFVVYGNLLPYWTLILNLIILCFIMYVEISKKGVS